MTSRGDFFEEDEPVEDVVRAFENGLTFSTSDNLTLTTLSDPWEVPVD